MQPYSNNVHVDERLLDTRGFLFMVHGNQVSVNPSSVGPVSSGSMLTCTPLFKHEGVAQNYAKEGTEAHGGAISRLETKVAALILEIG